MIRSLWDMLKWRIAAETVAQAIVCQPRLVAKHTLSKAMNSSNLLWNRSSKNTMQVAQLLCQVKAGHICKCLHRSHLLLCMSRIATRQCWASQWLKAGSRGHLGGHFIFWIQWCLDFCPLGIFEFFGFFYSPLILHSLQSTLHKCVRLCYFYQSVN